MSTLIVGTGGSGQPGISGGSGGGSTLVTQVASAVGGADEDNVRLQALDSLNRCRNEINMHDWRFLKRTVSSTAFVAGTATYSLPAVFKSPSFFRLLDTNSKQYRDLIYVDDATKTHSLTQQTHTGPPSIYSLRNSFADGLITFYPVPDAGTVTSYTWAGEYYTRMLIISDDSVARDDIPEEMANVLVAGGQYYLVSEREKGNPSIVNHKWQDYQRIKHLALVNDRRMTDESPRFRLGTPRGRVANTADEWLGMF